MSAFVYHFTDTARLPHILLSGELKAGRNRIGGFPDPDFIWATVSPLGDRTASASLDGLRTGLVRHVRFTLHASDFAAWNTIAKTYPTWTREQMVRLERAASGKSRPQDWFCRAEPLPCEAWVAIESRTWTDRTWRPVDLSLDPVVLDHETLGIEIDGKVYCSRAYEHALGVTGYHAFVGRRDGSA